MTIRDRRHNPKVNQLMKVSLYESYYFAKVDDMRFTNNQAPMTNVEFDMFFRLGKEVDYNKLTPESKSILLREYHKKMNSFI